MDAKKRLMVFISNETYLRNWIGAGAFDALKQDYELRYVIARDYWDPDVIRSFGVHQFDVISQSSWRKFFLRRLLTVTMYKHARKSRAFTIKLRFVRQRWVWLYKTLALPGIYQGLLAAIQALMPRWGEFEELVLRYKPAAVLAPSLAADSFTIDAAYSAKKLGVKSMLLINSWDNLVSKGVLPLPPDCVGVWGAQGVNQAARVQGVPNDRIVALGVPRFDRYFNDDGVGRAIDIHEFNGIPRGKKIVLYAATSIPFDDIAALEILDSFISTDPGCSDYIILFRPHPEMLRRKGERSFFDCSFSHVVLDQQVAMHYKARFDHSSKVEGSHINDTELEYYPALLKTVAAVVCPPTTLGVEGAMNGAPCLMICYGDGKNTWLSPDQMCQYESVEEVLAMPGVVPCRAESDLISCFQKIIDLSRNEQARDALASATRYVVYRDSTPYSERLRRLVGHLVHGRKLSIQP